MTIKQILELKNNQSPPEADSRAALWLQREGFTRYVGELTPNDGLSFKFFFYASLFSRGWNLNEESTFVVSLLEEEPGENLRTSCSHCKKEYCHHVAAAEMFLTQNSDVEDIQIVLTRQIERKKERQAALEILKDVRLSKFVLKLEEQSFLDLKKPDPPKLTYHFSDGKVLSSFEVAQHIYSALVPPELLPKRNDFLNVITQIENYLNTIQFEVETIEPVAINKINFGQFETHLWQRSFYLAADQTPAVRLDLTPLTQYFYSEDFCVDLKNGILTQVPWGDIVDTAYDSADVQSSLDIPLSLIIEGAESLETFFYHFQKSVLSRFKIKDDTPLRQVEFQPQIHFQDDGSLQFARSFEDLQIWGFSPEVMYLLYQVDRGVAALLFGEAHDLACRTKTDRHFELRAFKHAGLAQWLLFEALNAVFFKKLSDGSEAHDAESVFLSLKDRIPTLVDPKEREGRLTIKAQKHFLEALRSIFLILKTKDIYSPQGLLQSETALYQELRLIQCLLSLVSTKNSGAQFLKPRSSLQKILNLNEFSDYKFKALDHGFLLPQMEDSSRADKIFALSELLESGFQFFINNSPVESLRPEDFVSNLKVDEQNIDWFELHPEFFLKGKKIEASEAENFLTQGVVEYRGTYYLLPVKKLPSLERLGRFWQRLQGQNSKRSNLSQKIFQLPKNQVMELLALRNSGVDIQGGERFQAVVDFFDSLDQPRKDFEIPQSLQCELKSFQKKGVRWLYDLYTLRLGALLADEMGLGKTVQTIAFLEKLREEGKLGQVLIVVPTSMTFNWMSECKKFAPDLAVSSFVKSENPQGVLITTYGLLTEHQEYFKDKKFNIVIFDEAQNLKNIVARRTTAARSLEAQFKICLSGTPLENHFGEFYSLMDLILPGSLGTYDYYRKTYINPAQIAAAEIDYLKLRVKPLVLRRTKAELHSEFQLPEKTESKVVLTFSSKQKKIYRDIALSYNQKIREVVAEQGERKSQLQMLTALLRLRQVCSDPSALPGVQYTEIPPKIGRLVEALQEITEAGECAIVFTQFLRTLERVEAELLKHKISVLTLHGSIERNKRHIILQNFEDLPAGGVLLMTLKTGGVGLNLTKANYVFHLEPWWNPAVENQATDRVHRLGQQRSVQVYRYIMHESVEEKIELLKARKSERFNALFSENEDGVVQSAAHLSQKDFELLLT